MIYNNIVWFLFFCLTGFKRHILNRQQTIRRINMRKRRFNSYGKTLLLSVMVGFFVYIISNGMIINNCNAIFGEYSKDDYEYLLEIAEKAVVEGKGIHTEEIPKDVDYKIEQFSNGEDIKFTYALSKKGLLEISPEVTITLSVEDKKILSQDFQWETEEEFIKRCNNQAKFFSVILGCFGAIVILVFYCLKV